LPDDFAHLMEMYATFSPKPASQGLPPQDPEACVRWVRSLLENGENFLAWKEGRVVGHVSLLPDREQKEGEFLIFVDRGQRNRGVGRALTDLALKRAVEMGLRSIWLTVETYNFRAIHLYKRFEFQFCDQGECERKMICTM